MAVHFKRTEGGALPLVKSYGDGGFRVAGERFDGSILIVNGVVTPLPVGALADVTPDHLAAVVTADPGVEILLVGGGAGLVMPAAPLRDALAAAGVAFDPMDSGAAARTYNVLMLEDRRVAALLIAVP